MRRHRPEGTSLQGQVLFAEVDGSSVVVDCLLAGRAAPAAQAVTLRATLPEGTAGTAEALGMLAGWADDLAAVAVRITETPDGPEVRMEAATGLLVLLPAGSER